MKLHALLAISLVLPLSLLACQPSSAEQETSATEAQVSSVPVVADSVDSSDRSGRIAVLDLGKILDQCKACKAKLKDLEGERDRIKAKFEQTKKDLDAEKLTIQRKQTVLSEADFKAETKAFDKRAGEKMKSLDADRQGLITARSEALVALREDILKVIAEMAAAEKIGLIVDRQQVLLADSTLDITEAVLKRVDEVVE